MKTAREWAKDLWSCCAADVMGERARGGVMPRIRRMTSGEQASPSWAKPARGMLKWMKRCTSKLRRRQEREDPENAPKRNAYRGWFD